MDADEIIDPEEFVSAADAARIVGVTLVAIRSAVSDGRLPSRNVLGRIVVARADLEAYRERTREANGAKPRGRPKKTERSQLDFAKGDGSVKLPEELDTLAGQYPSKYRIGQRISVRRRELRMSQRALADQIQISRAMIGHIETGHAELNAGLVPTLCKALDVPPDYLFDGLLYPHSRDKRKSAREEAILRRYRSLPLYQKIAVYNMIAVLAFGDPQTALFGEAYPIGLGWTAEEEGEFSESWPGVASDEEKSTGLQNSENDVIISPQPE